MDPSTFRGGLAPITDIHMLEQIYNEAIPNTDTFDLVHRAVWFALHRLMPGIPIQTDGVNGGACYHLIANNEAAQLFVLKLSSSAAIVRLYLRPPVDPIEHVIWIHADHHAAISTLASVFAHCTAQIDDLLYTTVQLERHNPVCPPLSAGWAKIFRWHRLYAPAMTNADLGHVLNVTEGAVGNARIRHGEQRTGRGRPKKDEKG